MSLAAKTRSIVTIAYLLMLAGCRTRVGPAGPVVIAIESSPNNLDLRIGTDAQSERIGALIFDALAVKDEHYNLKPWLAERWEQPDALTWIFHLHDQVRFQDGRPLEAEDVAFTIRSMIDGTLITPKEGAFASIDRIETPDRLTVVIRLKRPDTGLLFNMSDGLFGVVPRGSDRQFGLHPIGSGPFKFVEAAQDKDVVLERNSLYWAAPRPDGTPIERLRFSVVPDAITTSLELQKGSVDLESNAITLDMVHTLNGARGLKTDSAPSSVVVYMNFNVTDPILRDKRVRQAIACAMDRNVIVNTLWRGKATLASSLLPPGHWARAADAELPQYPHDLLRAQHLLDNAGFPVNASGIRLRLTLKTSTDETTRLVAIVLQQQLRAAGIDLRIRSADFGTFYSDVTRGAFQLYVLRWIGSNEDPDIFRYAYGTSSFPPQGGNRGRYSNPEVDALLARAASSTDPSQRRRNYVEVQKVLADELPGIPLWYPDNIVVHADRMTGISPQGSGGYAYLDKSGIR